MSNPCLRCLPAFLLITVTATSSALHAQEIPAPTIVEVAPMATPRPVPDGRFHVQLADGSLLVGRFTEGEQFKLKSVVGAIDIPVKKISTINFEKNRNARVTFRNSDALSGELEGTELALETSFGEIKIQLATIVAIISHEQFTNAGTVTQRVIRKTEDGEVIQWQTHSATSPYASPASYNGGYAPRSTPATPAYYGVPAAVPSFVPAPAGATAPRR